MYKKILKKIRILYLILSIMLFIVILPYMFISSTNIFFKNFNWYTSYVLIEFILGVNLCLSLKIFDKQNIYSEFKVVLILMSLLMILTQVIGSLSGGLNSKYYYFTANDGIHQIILEEISHTVIAYKKNGLFIKKICKIYSDTETHYILKNNYYKIEWNNNIMKFYYAFDDTKSIEKMYCVELDSD